jgi:hypothetical protein
MKRLVVLASGTVDEIESAPVDYLQRFIGTSGDLGHGHATS